MPEGKRCRNCAQHKPFEAFYVSRQASDGRQAWCKECHAARKRNPEATLRHALKWERANREKKRAHQRVRKAVRSGRLDRPDACEACGNSVELHAHHDDYSKPLEVRWLCRACHVAVHQEVVNRV